MKLRALAAMMGLVAFSLVEFHRAEAAQPSGGSEKADSKQDESLAVRCARAQLRLAELSLEKAQSMNRRVPGTLTSTTIALFSDDLEYAKIKLKDAQEAEGDTFRINLDRAEMKARLAKAKYGKVMEVNQRSPGAMQPTDVERAQLAAEVAELQFQHGKALAAGTAEAKLQWQLEMITDELAQVKQAIYLLGQNRLGQF